MHGSFESGLVVLVSFEFQMHTTKNGAGIMKKEWTLLGVLLLMLPCCIYLFIL